MARNERAFNLAQTWIGWLDTRRFFAPPEQKNILARMMQDMPSRGAPNGELSADIFAFNLCVVSLPVEQLVPFIVVYCQYKPRPIKVMSHELGVSAPTFYRNAHEAAMLVLSNTDKLVMLNMQLRKEVEGLH